MDKLVYAESGPNSQIGATLEALYSTIEARRGSGYSASSNKQTADKGANSDTEEEYADKPSYTKGLLLGPVDNLVKKVCEESLECALAVKDVEKALAINDSTKAETATSAPSNCISADSDVCAQIDHLRYECGDVLYHLMVLLARYDISLDEIAAELNQRMKDDERPENCVLLKEEHVRRRL